MSQADPRRIRKKLDKDENPVNQQQLGGFGFGGSRYNQQASNDLQEQKLVQQMQALGVPVYNQQQKGSTPYREKVSLDAMIDELGADDLDAEEETKNDEDAKLAMEEERKPRTMEEIDAEEARFSRAVGLASPFYVFWV